MIHLRMRKKTLETLSCAAYVLELNNLVSSYILFIYIHSCEKKYIDQVPVCSVLNIVVEKQIYLSIKLSISLE